MLVSTGVMSNISPQKNARTPEQNISLRNLCKNFWLEETAILDMQMSKLPMIFGYALNYPISFFSPVNTINIQTTTQIYHIFRNHIVYESHQS